MDIAKQHLIKSYLSNLQVDVNAIGYNRVLMDWREIDYIPNYNKFYLICDGDGWIKIGDSEFYPKSKQMILMPEGIEQSYSLINDDVYTKYWCHFTAKIGNLNLFDLIQMPYLMETTDFVLLESIFRELLLHQSSSALSASLLLKSALLRLISYYLEHSVLATFNSPNSETIGILNTTLNYINRNFHHNLTINKLAAISYLHPNYFIRLFKKNMGTTPIQYINKKRIEEAKRLLNSTNLSLSEIGVKVGVSDIFYLSKLFKAQTGFSPTTYKEINTAEAAISFY
ncbi:AraC family transcriptional regulator [Paenibacillus psychroresistens]|uniref:AraC family transcriptional regulator n=1 Tax=Paenibacillus psychroresistens TaxID=1778678 RepID=A0A6B8RFA0_9BACL|nr:AraC family transcriptional regulator [Paenibacillus psychroresistens]QGQ95161.1 AraC family transcriptional regulator [Paenibacillus psychroresistens]